MKLKNKIGIIVVLLFLCIIPYANAWFNTSYDTRLTLPGLIDSSKKIPVVINLPDECECVEEECKFIEGISILVGEPPVLPLDTNFNGKYDHVVYLTNTTSSDNIPLENTDFGLIKEDGNLKGLIYKNFAVIRFIEPCFVKDGVWGCLSEKEALESVYLKGDLIIQGLNIGNQRYDLYTVLLKINISENIDIFCPITLHLGSWPKRLIIGGFEKNNGEILYPNFFELDEGRFEGGLTEDGRLYLGNSITLEGENQALVLTAPRKPSNFSDFYETDKLEVQSDYFFLVNGNVAPIIAAVCTDEKELNLEIMSGPHIYFFPNSSNLISQEDFILTELLSYPLKLEMIKETIDQFVHVRGLADPLYFQTPEIQPTITLRSPLNLEYKFIWADKSGQRTDTKKGREVTFNEYVKLEGNKLGDFEKNLFPFDRYHAHIKIETSPIYLESISRDLKIEENTYYEGKLILDHNDIEIKVYPTHTPYLLVLFSWLFSISLLITIKKKAQNYIIVALLALTSLLLLFLIEYIYSIFIIIPLVLFIISFILLLKRIKFKSS